jgi:hypothetical protein
MKRWQHKVLACLFASCWLGLAGTVSAGPYVNVMQPCDCPPTHYSSLHIIAPAFYRWAAWCQGPCRYTFARVLRPEVATTYNLKRYHCPAVNPLQFAVQNYVGLGGNIPSSTYQPRQEPTKAGELPPPTAENRPAPEKLPPPNVEPQQ